MLAARAGQYQAACSGFHDAARLFNSAINALIAEPMQTDAERDLVKRQAYANAAQAAEDRDSSYCKE